MKILIDMNLSPKFSQLLADSGWESIHWSTVDHPGASDREIIEWADGQ